MINRKALTVLIVVVTNLFKHCGTMSYEDKNRDLADSMHFYRAVLRLDFTKNAKISAFSGLGEA